MCRGLTLGPAPVTSWASWTLGLQGITHRCYGLR